MNNEELIQELEAIAKERYELEQQDDELSNRLLEGIAKLFKDFRCPHCGNKFQNDELWMPYWEYNDWQLRCSYHCGFSSPRFKSLSELLGFMEVSREFFKKKSSDEEV